MLFNSLPHDKIFDVTKLKAFADVQLNIVKMTIFLFDRAQNTGDKEKMLVNSIFSFSPSVSKALFFRVVKSRDCVVKSERDFIFLCALGPCLAIQVQDLLSSIAQSAVHRT